MVSLYIWLSIYTNNEILCIIRKFDLSSRGVLGRIYALSIEVLTQFILSKQQTGKEDKGNTAHCQAESHEGISWPAYGHQAIQNKANKKVKDKTKADEQWN